MGNLIKTTPEINVVEAGSSFRNVWCPTAGVQFKIWSYNPSVSNGMIIDNVTQQKKKSITECLKKMEKSHEQSIIMKPFRGEICSSKWKEALKSEFFFVNANPTQSKCFHCDVRKYQSHQVRKVFIL